MNRSGRDSQVRLPHVALIVETSTAFGRAILEGISQYVHEHGPWTVYIEQRSLQDDMPPWIERWNGDGIISRASTPESARKVVQTGIPTVDLNDQVRDTGLPQVHADHAAIAVGNSRRGAVGIERSLITLGLMKMPSHISDVSDFRGKCLSDLPSDGQVP